jgi:hypothetical protein
MKCKNGKLKHPKGRRICKKTGRKSRRGRRSRRTSPLLKGILLGAVLVGATTLIPSLA